MSQDLNTQASQLGFSNAKDLLATNTVLRNTYIMLSLTLLFSAFTAMVAMSQNAAPMNFVLMLVVVIGFPFLLQATKNSPLGIVFTFAYTGFIGWMLGPILNMYIANFSNGSEIIMMALGSTGLIFLGLSAFALNTKRNFSHWGRMLFIGMIVAFVASLLNIFLFKIPAFQLAISVLFSIVSAGYIMYMTNSIVHGGEKNYLVATVILYVSIINIFLTLLQLLSLFAGNRN